MKINARAKRLYTEITGKKCPRGVIRPCSGFPIPERFDATTIGPVIFMKPAVIDDIALQVHELVHIEQWHSNLYIVFWWKYLRFLYHRGYEQIPYEIHAKRIQILAVRKLRERS